MAFESKVLTANHLHQGTVVYLDENSDWTMSLEKALVLDNEEYASELLAKAEKQQDIVIGAYLADVDLETNNSPKPSHIREFIRAHGPSSYIGATRVGHENGES